MTGAKAMPAADGSVISYGVLPVSLPKQFWALENHFNRTSTISVTVAIYRLRMKEGLPVGSPIFMISLRIFGSGGRDRTYDQLINSQLLYR